MIEFRKINIKRTLLFTVVIFFLSYAYCFSEDRSDLIRQYLDKSGIINALKKTWAIQTEITAVNLTNNHNLSSKFIADFKEVWMDVNLYDLWAHGGLFDMMKPMFDSLTNDDLQQIIKFYESPPGSKMADIANHLDVYLADSMKLMQQRIQNVLLPEIIERLEVRGWDKNGKRIR